MKLNDLASTGAIALPWPVVLNGVRLARTQLPESETCQRKCGLSPSCASDVRGGEFVCAHGLSYFRFSIPHNEILVYGLRGPKNTTPLNVYTRDGLKGRAVTVEALNVWIASLQSLINVTEDVFKARQTEMLDPLHDPMRIAKQINTIANRLVLQQSRGSTFEQQIDNASFELKTLVKAADLLADSFDLLSIYFNPAAASYGKRISVSLHGLLTKLVAIFRIDDGGLTRSNPRIYLNGSCHRNAFVHESFKLVPFALLSNAVKYSVIGNIDVSIVDRQIAAEITVQSTGPYIEEDERLRIFEKRGRGKWAKKLIDGRGVGLYLASIIAKAHGFELRVASRKTGEVRDEIPLAVNRFYFEVPYQG